MIFRAQELTPREREIAVLLRMGHKVSAIAERTGITRRTVHAHIQSAAKKLGGSGPPSRRLAVWAATHDIDADIGTHT